MAGDKFYIVRDPGEIDGSYDHLWSDYKTDDERLGSICFGYRDEEPMDSDKLVRIILGTGPQTWREERSVIYADQAKALADAKKRLAEIKKKRAAAKGTKKASVSERIVERFKSAKG